MFWPDLTSAHYSNVSQLRPIENLWVNKKRNNNHPKDLKYIETTRTRKAIKKVPPAGRGHKGPQTGCNFFPSNLCII
jgi:hypothetical protein